MGLHLLEAQGALGSGPRYNFTFFYHISGGQNNVRSRGLLVGFFYRSPVSCIHPIVLSLTHSLMPGQ